MSNLSLYDAFLRYAFTVVSNVVIYVVAWAYFGLEAGGEVGPEDAGSFTVR